MVAAVGFQVVGIGFRGEEVVGIGFPVEEVGEVMEAEGEGDGKKSWQIAIWVFT